MMYEDFLSEEIPIFSLYGVMADGSCECGNPDCRAILKHPRASNWQHSPVFSEDQIEVMEFMGHLKTGYGVLITGKLLLVDTDARNGGVASYAKLCERIPDVAAAGLIVKTGSGGGSQHNYMLAPPGVALMQSHPDYPGIDFKSTGYVVGPGSLHASGNRYEAVIGTPADITPAPAALIELLRRPERHRSTVDGKSVDISTDELRELLEAIPNNSSTDYEVFIRVGMGVHEVTKGTGFELWDEWAKRSDKYNSAEMDKKWHSFGKSANPVTLGTLRHYAESAGWREPVTFTDQTLWIEEVAPAAPCDPLDTSGIDLLRPPGFVGQLANWIDRRNRHPRHNLAVAASLSVVSAVAGMRYIDPLDGITPNLFAFGVAGSATGKESILKSAQELLRAAGVSAAVHGGIKSEQEIYRNLIRHQAAIYLIDEMGEQLAKITNARKKGTAAYLEGVIGAVLSAYSKANSHLLVTGDLKEEIRKAIKAEYAALVKSCGDDPEEDDDAMRLASIKRQLDAVEHGIENPYLCIVGLTTPERFDQLMDYDMAANGFMGRSLIFRERDDNPRSRERSAIRRGPVPDAIAGTLQMLYAPGYSAVPSRVERIGDQVEMETKDDAAELLDRIVRYFEEMAEEQGATGMTAIPRRGYEQVAKVSMLLGIPEGVRTVEHVRWAFALVKRDVADKIKLAYSNSTSDKQDALSVRIMSLVTAEHGITAGVMRNKCRSYTPTDVDKCADLLVERGLLRCEEVPRNRNGGVTKKYFANA